MKKNIFILLSIILLAYHPTAFAQEAQRKSTTSVCRIDNGCSCGKNTCQKNELCRDGLCYPEFCRSDWYISKIATREIYNKNSIDVEESAYRVCINPNGCKIKTKKVPYGYFEKSKYYKNTREPEYAFFEALGQCTVNPDNIACQGLPDDSLVQITMMNPPVNAWKCDPEIGKMICTKSPCILEDEANFVEVVRKYANESPSPDRSAYSYHWNALLNPNDNRDNYDKLPYPANFICCEGEFYNEDTHSCECPEGKTCACSFKRPDNLRTNRFDFEKLSFVESEDYLEKIEKYNNQPTFRVTKCGDIECGIGGICKDNQCLCGNAVLKDERNYIRIENLYNIAVSHRALFKESSSYHCVKDKTEYLKCSWHTADKSKCDKLQDNMPSNWICVNNEKPCLCGGRECPKTATCNDGVCRCLGSQLPFPEGAKACYENIALFECKNPDGCRVGNEETCLQGQLYSTSPSSKDNWLEAFERSSCYHPNGTKALVHHGDGYTLIKSDDSNKYKYICEQDVCKAMASGFNLAVSTEGPIRDKVTCIKGEYLLNEQHFSLKCICGNDKVDGEIHRSTGWACPQQESGIICDADDGCEYGHYLFPKGYKSPQAFRFVICGSENGCTCGNNSCGFMNYCIDGETCSRTHTNFDGYALINSEFPLKYADIFGEQWITTPTNTPIKLIQGKGIWYAVSSEEYDIYMNILENDFKDINPEDVILDVSGGGGEAAVVYKTDAFICVNKAGCKYGNIQVQYKDRCTLNQDKTLNCEPYHQ